MFSIFKKNALLIFLNNLEPDIKIIKYLIYYDKRRMWNALRDIYT